MEQTAVFVVSADAALRDSAYELIAPAGLRVETFESLDQWLAAVAPQRPGCLVLEAQSGAFREAERLALFADICARRPVLLLVDRGDVPCAVKALRRGAVDVVEKPYRDERLLERIERALAADVHQERAPRAG